MFDSVYVLAKGGICVYSGLPKNLRQHLNECHIDCNENQIPIEVIIKLSFNGINDNSVQQLSQKTLEIENNFKKQNLLKAGNGLKTKPKSFSLIDFWYLLIRFLYRNYISQRKGLLNTLILFAILVAFIVNCFNKRISEIDGCFEANSPSNMSCFEISEAKHLINENEFLIYYSIAIFPFILNVIQINGFVSDMMCFRTEHRNREFQFIYQIYVLMICIGGKDLKILLILLD